jgi:hypothetical protein
MVITLLDLVILSQASAEINEKIWAEEGATTLRRLGDLN